MKKLMNLPHHTLNTEILDLVKQVSVVELIVWNMDADVETSKGHSVQCAQTVDMDIVNIFNS